MFVFRHARRKRLRFGAVAAGLSGAIEGIWARSRWARAPLFPFRSTGAFAGKVLLPECRTGHSGEPDNGCRTKRYPRRFACFPLFVPPVLFLSSSLFAAPFFFSYFPGVTGKPFFTRSPISAFLYKVTSQFYNRLIPCVLIRKMHLRR